MFKVFRLTSSAMNNRYYQAYLKFFTEQSENKSLGELLEEYIFSPEANLASSTTKDPGMFDRFTAGLLHPLIHTGLGLEFVLPGIVTEGAQSCNCHLDDALCLRPF